LREALGKPRGNTGAREDLTGNNAGLLTPYVVSWSIIIGDCLMPRRALPPPTQGLKVEGLSEIKDNHDEAKTKAMAEFRDNQRQMLTALGITVPGYVPPKPKPIPPKLAHNQRIVILAGEPRVITTINPNALKRRI